MARQAIQNRTIFYDSSKNRYRLFDWALCNTSQGACWEPVSVQTVPDGDTGAYAAIDPDDIIARIDRIEFGFDSSYPFYTDVERNGNKKSPPLMGGLLTVGFIQSYLPDDINVR
jgi:hypothetical protein